MTEKEITQMLSVALVQCGIPEWTIDEESNIKLDSSNEKIEFHADLIVVTDAGELPLAVFEVRRRGDQKRIYATARRELLSLLSKGIRCFVVTESQQGEVQISELKKTRWSRPSWHLVSDHKRLKRLLGDYAAQSNRVIKLLDKKEDRMKCFRWWIMLVGGGTVGYAAQKEMSGMEYSWKIYSLIGLVFALYAVSYGISIKIGVGDYEISLYPKSEKQKKKSGLMQTGI